MPVERFFTIVFAAVLFTILQEAGPEIFVQSHSLIVPSGSLVALPSSNILSVGKVIALSEPARAVGGLGSSLLQEVKGAEIQVTKRQRICKRVHCS